MLPEERMIKISPNFVIDAVGERGSLHIDEEVLVTSVIGTDKTSGINGTHLTKADSAAGIYRVRCSRENGQAIRHSGTAGTRTAGTSVGFIGSSKGK